MSGMYEGPFVKPGDRVAFEKDGVIYTDTLRSVGYTSPTPAIWPERTLWQRIVRRLTPPRFRKPLKPIREATSSTVTVSVGDRNPIDRHMKTVADLQKMVDGFKPTT